MFKSIRSFSYVVLVSFIVNALTLGNALALDVEAWQEMLMSDEVIQGVFGGVISEQSEPGDMESAVAPAPRVIELSNGDIAIRFSDSAQASVATTAEGLTEVTYSMSGARVKVKDDTGEEFEFQYELEGSVVKLINSNGAVVRQESYNNLGQLLTTSAQGTTEYVYSEDGLNTLLKSIDQWGNETIYDDEGRPDYAQFTDVDGTVVVFRDYTFDNNGIMESIVDENGSTITFLEDGVRVDEITNFAGTLTTSYQYDSITGNLISVTDHVSDSITMVVDGEYTQTYDIIEVVDEEGNVVLDENNEPVTELVLKGTYNYDDAGNVASVTSIGEEGIITGWTDYDEFGRISGTYNQEGVMVQSYLYNEHGFLQQTMNLGAVDTLTGDQTLISVTNFDKKGRPMEVWQIGSGGNKVKIQEYAYKENGLLDVTYSLGILRGTDETNEATFNNPVDENGNLITNNQYVYFKTSITEFDKKGRPETVYSFVRNTNNEYVSGYDVNGNAITTSDPSEAILEKQQIYLYDSRGFLSETKSYGYNNKVTGTTEFDRYGRPENSYNGQGATSQEYIYDDDGFLTQTINKGENGVTTSWTNYDAKGKPVDVFNSAGTLTQKYVYDENGLMVKSLNLNGEDGVNADLVCTIADLELIAAMCNFNTGDILNELVYDEIEGNNIPPLNEALMAEVWNTANSTDFRKKCALTVIQLFTDGAKGADQNLINDVGSAYHMLGQLLEAEEDYEGAIAAYKIQVSEFTGALAVPAEGGDPVSVSAWSTSRLSSMTDANGDPVEVNTAVVTGYTIFGGDSKPIASYQCFDDGVNGLQISKVQDYDYSYEVSSSVVVGYDEDNNRIYDTVTTTKYSNFVRKTINYGDFTTDENGDFVLDEGGNKIQEQIGYISFDDYGRQLESFNEEGNITQKYTYSKDGFLDVTYSYGKDKALTGTTIFDNYSRPVASFNAVGKATDIPDDFIQALSDGLSASDMENTAWQPYLKGLSQTFEYGADGLLETSKSWGEAVEINVSNLSNFADALGSVKGDVNYNIAYDYNEDGEINQDDMNILESKFSGAESMVNQYLSGTVAKTDLNTFAGTFSSKVCYEPTQTGFTVYSKYGKAAEVYNAEPIKDSYGNIVADGVLTQKYIYNERGFMTKSESYGIQMDEYGTVTMDGDIPAALLTGYTLFDAGSKPSETYQIYHKMDIDDNGNVLADYGVQEAKVQNYVFEGGFLVQTNNYSRNGADAGNTTFDKYGRQTTSYNEFGQKTAAYFYSAQGFLNQTSSYGSNNAYLGKTIFDKKGKPVESYNMTASGNTQSGLTQTFEYNEYGVLTNSISYSQDQILTGQTFYNGYGKAMYSTNDVGITNSAYKYDEFGFMDYTLALSWVSDSTGAQTATHNNLNDAADALNGTSESGYYVVSGYTEFGDTSRPEVSYQCWEPTQGYGEGAKVQEYNYSNGFLTSTSNYGKDATFIGITSFDKYGRQNASYNEVDVDNNGLGEKTSKYSYSSQGFLQLIYNYGLSGSLVGKTTFNSLGRPVESYNQKNSLTQTFHYDSFTGAMDESYSWGEATIVDEVSTATLTGTTEYDAWGKAITQYNDDGNIVAKYEYDDNGFMTRAFSFSGGTATDVGVCTGYTNYSAAGRPDSSYAVFNPTTEGGDLMCFEFDPYFYLGVDENTTGVTLVQNFIYNTDVTKTPEDINLIGNSNTGFLTMSISYGDEQEFMGYTTFSRYGQQEYSYNELGEKTTRFTYSSAGFLSETKNYGIDAKYNGKTVFNAAGRPEGSYNEKGVLVQTFDYTGGFLVGSTSYGDPGEGDVGAVTGTTTYDEYGKQLESFNSEGALVGTFEYSVNGFMTRSNSMAAEGIDAEGNSIGVVRTGYTNYDNKVRPVDSYSVYNGNYESLSQVFSYDNDGASTGFVTGAQSYVVNNDYDFGTATVASTIGTEVLYAGYVEYNNYGRPENSYNKEGTLISKNSYNSNGFISKTDNYGEDGRKVGSLVYNDIGRPEYATNHAGGVTTTYIYNDAGFLSQTIGYTGGSYNETTGQVDGVITSYTTFDVYSKSLETYQVWTHSGQTTNGYTYDANGTANYTVNSDGSLSGGGLTSVNMNETINGYSSFGSLLQTSNIGRQGSTVSTTKYDSFSKPTSVWNEKGSLVQVYHYSAQGFLDYSISYAEMKSYDDNGDPVDDGDWDTTETTITFFDDYGQQTQTSLLTNDGSSETGWNLVAYIQGINGQEGLTIGAKQSEYVYDNDGFMSQTKNYQDGQYTGYMDFDASGRQSIGYNASGTATSTYYYDINGFLTRSTQTN
ncbi:MAG: hypothetical protein L6416_08900 [Candidatus Omnitrophica bacterium]|nr:hypothetical protein [Candidatus Omnitrophota bacterium]